MAEILKRGSIRNAVLALGGLATAGAIGMGVEYSLLTDRHDDSASTVTATTPEVSSTSTVYTNPGLQRGYKIPIR